MSLPPFISASDRNSFAAFTLTERFPYIIDQLLKENELDEAQVKQLEELRNEILYGHIPEKTESQAINADYWLAFARNYSGKSYYEVPFFAVESYIYFRIEQIVNFEVTGRDVFLQSKLRNLDDNINFIKKLAKLQAAQIGTFTTAYLHQLLLTSLWGNSSDLSQLSNNQATTQEMHRKELLIDDSVEICRFISEETKTEQIHFIADNAGLELITDLLLIDYLLFHKRTPSVVLHVKHHPTFVSDAIKIDIDHHLHLLEKMNDRNCHNFATRIRTYLEDEQLTIKDHEFWNTGKHFTELPESITNSFAKGSLIIIKGDANYRRLFEDRMWPMTTLVKNVLGYLSNFKVASIRTLKSEIILGLNQKQVDSLTQLDEPWLTNGSYGLINFI